MCQDARSTYLFSKPHYHIYILKCCIVLSVARQYAEISIHECLKGLFIMKAIWRVLSFMLCSHLHTFNTSVCLRFKRSVNVKSLIVLGSVCLELCVC